MIATVPLQHSAEQRVIKRDVTWRQYDAMVRDSDGRRSRIAFDQGVLEIMSPSRLHETAGHLIGRLIEAFADARDIDIAGVKATTFRCEDMQRGFEADESYYITHAKDVRGMDEIDLSLHPGPDLVLEVDISRSSMPKFGIYSALRVSEVWLYDGSQLRAFVLRATGNYAEVSNSEVLPDFPLSTIPDWLDRMTKDGETKTIRAFRKQQEQLTAQETVEGSKSSDCRASAE